MATAAARPFQQSLTWAFFWIAMSLSRRAKFPARSIPSRQDAAPPNRKGDLSGEPQDIAGGGGALSAKHP